MGRGLGQRREHGEPAISQGCLRLVWIANGDQDSVAPHPLEGLPDATGIEPMARCVRGGICCGCEKKRAKFGVKFRFVINGSIRGMIAGTTDDFSPSFPSQLTMFLGTTQSSVSTLDIWRRTEESSIERADILLLPNREAL